MQAIYEAKDTVGFEQLASEVNEFFREYEYASNHRIVATGSLMDHVKFENRLRSIGLDHKFRLI